MINKFETFFNPYIYYTYFNYPLSQSHNYIYNYFPFVIDIKYHYLINIKWEKKSFLNSLDQKIHLCLNYKPYLNIISYIIIIPQSYHHSETAKIDFYSFI